MISVEDALERIRHNVKPLDPVQVGLGEALGLRLAEPVVSDADSPPFDKAMLDGFAISASDPAPTRRVIEQVIAGGVPRHAIEPGTAILVMTGAPVPRGATAVVKHEDTTRIDETTIQLPSGTITPGGGVFRRGESFQQGQQVIPSGRILRSVEIALLAEVGRASVSVVPRPRVAVLATGNELVESGQPVELGQIRNSNGPMLLAALTEAGLTPLDLGIARDDVDLMRSAINNGLEADVLLISGGVSAGMMDLVPSVLAELGVEQVFHKVRMKPGKPLWFGRRDGEKHRTLVFGLPGNPVSTLVAYQLFVKPALAAIAGSPFEVAVPIRGQLTAAVKHRGERPTYRPCRMVHSLQGTDSIEPLVWRGSADLAAFVDANGLMILSAGDYELAVGTAVDALPL